MRFTLFYQNTQGLREQIFPHLIHASRQMDLSQNPLNTQHFRTFPNWPDVKTILNLPLNVQIEELEIIGDVISCLKKMIIDSE